MSESGPAGAGWGALSLPSDRRSEFEKLKDYLVWMSPFKYRTGGAAVCIEFFYLPDRSTMRKVKR